MPKYKVSIKDEYGKSIGLDEIHITCELSKLYETCTQMIKKLKLKVDIPTILIHKN